MMKKAGKKKRDGEMRKEYDFSQGVRGKYYRAYRQGHTVKIREADGTVTVQHFTLADGAVMLDPGARAYFPNSKAVNNTLRSIIALVPSRNKRRTNVSKGR